MKDYSDLIEEGRLKPGRFSQRQVEDCLRISQRDLKTARAVLKRSPEWAFNIAYNSMHQAGRAFLFHQGYRAVGVGHHATVVQFLEAGLGSEYQQTLVIMDRMRRNRNRATYLLVGTISRKQAEEAIAAAEEFLPLITDLVIPSKK